MNLNRLFSVILCRGYEMRENPALYHRPVIKYCLDEDRIDDISDIFSNVENIFLDFRTLALAWEKLIPYEGMSLEAKQMEICEWIGGKRFAYDVYTLIQWIKSDCDIGNNILLTEIENKEWEKNKCQQDIQRI